ncbi:hypothetical protein [Peribacillus loiseleuriae]|uniref:hypothetical protein n=1 Tax=Peribacillus loiseleuriae TaxID=1679170 RepID=UPI003D064202
MQQVLTKQNTLLDMYNDGDFSKDEWRTQNEIIRNEHLSLSNRKVELQILLKREKDTDNTVRAFEKQVHTLINLNIEDERNLKLIFHKLINKIHFNFKNQNIPGT